MSQTSHLVALGRGGSLGTALVCFCWWAWFLLVWLLTGVCHCAGFSIWRLSFGLGLGFGLCSLTVACVGYAVLQFKVGSLVWDFGLQDLQNLGLRARGPMPRPQTMRV